MNAQIGQNAREVCAASVSQIREAAEDLHAPGRLMRQDGLEFVAHVVARHWLANSSPQSDEAVMRVLTSGNEAAAQVVVIIAYQNRAQLGTRWWRLLFMCVLWAGLSVLAPRYDEEALAPLWSRWLRRLRSRRLSGVAANVELIEPPNIARRAGNF